MICENCGKEVSGPYCPNCGQPTGLYSNMKLEYDPDNFDNNVENKQTVFSDNNEELRKTVVRRGDKLRQAEEEKKEQKIQNSQNGEKAQKENKSSFSNVENVQPQTETQESDRWIIPPLDFFEKEKESKFTGGAFGLFFVRMFVTFITTVTLGLAYPAMVCFYYKWIASHTEINGRKMYFDGKGLQLFGKYVLWGFLTFITIGIYSFWFAVNMKKWIVSHTHYLDEAGEDKKSEFTGGAFGLFFVRLWAGIVTLFTLSLGAYWAKCYVQRWTAKHTVIDGHSQFFDGKGMQFFGKCALWLFLTVITLGIYSFWLAVNLKKWTVSHTQGED